MKRSKSATVVLFAAITLRGESGPAKPSPSELRIAQLQVAIEKAPGQARNYNELAAAYAQRGKETLNAEYYAKAGEALKKTLALEPGNIESGKVEVSILLGRRDAAAALERAVALNHRVPDDIRIYGYIVDAASWLGDYRQAENAAQWMLRLRPGNVPALLKTAYLREVFGDFDGAVEALNLAYRQTNTPEVWERAQMLASIGHLQMMQGNPESAERALDAALSLYPDSLDALGYLADLRIEQDRTAEAVEILERRYRLAPRPEHLYALASALDVAGRKDEAEKAFREFAEAARGVTDGNANANRELVFFYADHAGQPEKALEVADREWPRRKDVSMRDARAWALYRAGRLAEARKEMQAAVSVGTRDPAILNHAAIIGREAAALAVNGHH